LPTSSPTITPTPLPQKPDGAQTFDLIRSLWTKTDDGVDFYYNPEMESWTTALNKRPIYLISAKNYTKDVASVLPTGYTSMKLYYYRMADSEEPFVSVEEPSEYNNNWFGDTFDLDPVMVSSPHELLLMALAQRVYNLEEEELTAKNLQDILISIQDHTLILPLDIPNDVTNKDSFITKYWDPNNNIDIIQVPWENAVNDPTFLGQARYDHRWKLDIRGGSDEDHPGNLVVFFSVPFSNRFRRDWSEANLNLLGPIYVAVQSQEKPGSGEAVFGGDVQDFTSSASITASFEGSSPFLEYQCNQFLDPNTPAILYCYSPSGYLLRKNP
jgi:hypothetical protein